MNPRRHETPEEMQAAIDRYFAECDSRTREIVTKGGEVLTVSFPKPYTVEGLALALGFTSRRALLNYLKYDEGAYVDIIERAKLRIADSKVSGMQDGTLNVTGCIFDLKNNYQYVDQQLVEQTVRQKSARELDDDELYRIASGDAENSEHQPD